MKLLIIIGAIIFYLILGIGCNALLMCFDLIRFEPYDALIALLFTLCWPFVLAGIIIIYIASALNEIIRKLAIKFKIAFKR